MNKISENISGTRADIEPQKLDFYSFFTKYSLMEEYGFTVGLINRVFRKVLPTVPDTNTVEYFLLNQQDSVSSLLSLLNLENIKGSEIHGQLDLSIKALCSKVIAFGLDKTIKAKYNFLNLNSEPFENLLEKITRLTEYNKEEVSALLDSLEAIEILIIELRKKKNRIGTNFHLTLTTRRILEYTGRIKQLVDLRLNISSQNHWEYLLSEYLVYLKNKDSLRTYIGRHSDLVALEIVEHTSNKGQKYIAETRKDYRSFFNRSMLGGGIIAVFALFKMHIDTYQFTQLNDAFFFSLNYALCFVLVKQTGGIIATKQPAMTASTIAKNIDAEDDLIIDSMESVTILIRKVFRSQFISVAGNFLMALTLACLIVLSFQLFNSGFLSGIIKPEYLIETVVPSLELVLFASVAGIFLALSGLISGYVDNKVVDANIGHRIRHSSIFLKSERFSSYLEKKAGVLAGNISLGFFLGSAFLLSTIFPFAIDIRHIAFSSAHVGYAVMSFDFQYTTIILALFGALLIGFINFLVSFSITLYLALKSRGANFRLIPKLIKALMADFFKNPLYYFFPGKTDPKAI